MDTLLKKYAERIEEMFNSRNSRINETTYVNLLTTERLLLEFLLEYVEFKESKKEK